VICAGADPFQISSMSKVVKVQISPASQRVELVTHRARMTVWGVSVGASGPASFAGQILDADTLFRNDNQATYATPAALAAPQGQGAYDLESLLAHELGH
jgi:hypothetical protein